MEIYLLKLNKKTNYSRLKQALIRQKINYSLNKKFNFLYIEINNKFKINIINKQFQIFSKSFLLLINFTTIKKIM